MALEIVQLPAGPMKNFSYLLIGQDCCCAVDPAMDAGPILQELHKRQRSLTHLFNTHGHHDHVHTNSELLTAYPQARWYAHGAACPQAHHSLKDGEQLQLNGSIMEILHTPGHSSGGVCFYLPQEQALFTGDTLFISRCGRADLADSDVRALFCSLQRLRQLPSPVEIYPGHDYGPEPHASLETELKRNPYLQCDDMESFIELRLGS